MEAEEKVIIPLKAKIIEPGSNTRMQEYPTTNSCSSDKQESQEMSSNVHCKITATKDISYPQKPQATSNEMIMATSNSSSESIESSKKKSSYSNLKTNSDTLPSMLPKKIPGWWIISKIRSMRYSKEISITVAFICLAILVPYSLKDTKNAKQGKPLSKS